MSSQEAFERAKPSYRLVTIGQAGHGKTTLSAALSKVLAKTFGGQEKSYEYVVTSHQVEFASADCDYTLIDCSSNTDDLNNRLSDGTPFDGAILVVSATEGVAAQAYEYVQLVKQAGIPYIAIFVNQCDLITDEEALELITMEARELLSNNDYPGDDVIIVRGSALGALQESQEWESKIIEFVSIVDADLRFKQRFVLG